MYLLYVIHSTLYYTLRITFSLYIIYIRVLSKLFILSFNTSHQSLLYVSFEL